MLFDRAEWRVRRHIVILILCCSAMLFLPLFDTRKKNSNSDWIEVINWQAGQAFDTSQWTLERGFLRNEEEQYYTGGAASNFESTPEALNLIARGERVANAAYRKGAADWRQARSEARYTSTSLLSKDAWQNLRVEIVASVRGSKGAWPAIWLRSPNTRGFAEVDLMEHLGREPELVHSTVHFGTSSSNRDVKTADRTMPGFQGRDVVYLAELTPQKLTVSIDNKPMLTMDRQLGAGKIQPLQQPFNLIINLALGGAWSGPIDEAALPATMTIKAIRVWQWRREPGTAEISASEQ
jgi:beta-glucanase (GH16 family)